MVLVVGTVRKGVEEVMPITDDEGSETLVVVDSKVLVGDGELEGASVPDTAGPASRSEVVVLKRTPSKR